MQFSQSRDSYLNNSSANSIILSSKIELENQEKNLVGGGSVTILTQVRNQPIFLSNLFSIKSKTTSIELNESSIN